MRVFVRKAKSEAYLNVEICEEGNQGNHVSNLEIQPTKRERARPYDSTAGLDDCQHKLKLRERRDRPSGDEA